VDIYTTKNSALCAKSVVFCFWLTSIAYSLQSMTFRYKSTPTDGMTVIADKCMTAVEISPGDTNRLTTNPYHLETLTD